MPTLTLTANAPAGTLLRHLSFAEVLEAHVHPGQYVTVTVPDHKPAFFALASSPGQPAELLLKAVGDAANVLTSLDLGATVEVSEPAGPGFGVDLEAPGPIVVLCNGSGISAVRPLLEALAPHARRRPVHFLYGVLTTAHRSFLADLERWARAGIQVRTVVGGDAHDWTGDVGYVQDVAQGAGLLTPDATVVLCGVPPMIEAAKILCAEAGIPDERVRLNF